MSERKIRNPIIPGFYPDPSICRVGEDFYMVCSSFEMYPGIPVFHSKDLANWEQLGYAMHKENGFHVEANIFAGGVMAPTIRYHEGLFYIINCNFCDNGNFIVTAENPAGPWSEPHWLSDVPGIDASIFFDEDGKTYIIGTGNVVERADGTMDRGIWVAEYDICNFKMVGKPTAIWDSALRNAASPEAPHIYKIGEYYYLVIAEGGTEHYHAVTVARSKEVLGWYEGNPANPVMTHRQFGFNYPIANVGHADLVDTPQGNWYAVLLASRTMEGIHKNLGRETYICPIIWERGWPVFSPKSGKIDWEYPADPDLPWTEYGNNHLVRDDFDNENLDFCWNFWGTPYVDFWKISDSNLKLKCMGHSISAPLKPLQMDAPKVYDDCVSFVGRRQVHVDFEAGCAMKFMPEEKESAGMIVLQASNHQYRVERIQEEGKQLLRLVLVTAEFDRPAYLPGFTSVTHEQVLSQVEWESEYIILKLVAKGQDYSFYYGNESESMQVLYEHADGKIINPEIIGGMVGTLLGMFASGNGIDSEKEASFDWFLYQGIE